MRNKIPTRKEALNLFLRYNQNESLIKHAKAVEGVMRYIARKFNEDEEKWGIIGLLHDLDYEKFPEQHCSMTKQILESEGYPPEYINSILSHAWGICSDVQPVHIMEKYLFAIDELTGLITAVVLVRPSKSIMDLEVRSVKKKWKEKSFAAGADRGIILKGAEMIGISLDELIQLTIDGMRTVAKEIGLG
ncbi:MAG: HDIG domain-containing metalloprotein [Candidatus Kapaibacteriales bacterium]